MVKGLYTAYTGLRHQQQKMDVISNNMANAATTGYKKEGTTAQAFDTMLMYKIKDMSTAADADLSGKANLGVKIGETYTDHSQGAFKLTSNPYDLALSGNGFFCVQFTDKAGNTSTKYTRDGSFTLKDDGYLTTKNGDYVLDANGSRIRLDTLHEAAIDQKGYITQNGRIVAQIGLQDFADYNYLKHYGENYYEPVEGATYTTSTAQMFEGYLEASNVQVVSEMVSLISVTRAYESNQKMMQTIDRTLEIDSTQLGRV